MFLKKYIVYIIVSLTLFILLIFPLYRFIKRQLFKNSQQNNDLQLDEVIETNEINRRIQFVENLQPAVLLNKLDRITPRRDLQNIARQLSHDLGVRYSDNLDWWSFFDPRGWTENDELVANNLIKYKDHYNTLALCYYQITNSRSLRNDVIKLLDNDQVTRVRKHLTI